MSAQPMTIAGLGMISCLGSGAEINAAAMRCDYDGFQETAFHQPYSAEPQLGASVALEGDEQYLRGIARLARMSQIAIQQAIAELPTDDQGLQVVFCLQNADRPGVLATDQAASELYQQVCDGLSLGPFDRQSCFFHQQRFGFISALRKAHATLYERQLPYVLVLGVDSLLNSAALSYYGGGLYGEGRRLLGDDHPNGFIPGEAAVAVLLSTPEQTSSNIMITGIGAGEEIATFDNADEPLQGDGMAQAIRHACQDAGIQVHDTQYRVSSVSGEAYFFKEAALSITRALKQKVPEHQLLHPADSIGEVGAAVGGAMLVMDYYALRKGYAPGNRGLHMISNDNTRRGAYIIEKQEPTHGE